MVPPLSLHLYTVNGGFWIMETQTLSVMPTQQFTAFLLRLLPLRPCVRVWATRRPRQRVWGARDRAPQRKRFPPSAFLPWSAKCQRTPKCSLMAP